MRIELTSIHVNNQDEALTFYTEVLGFVVKENFPVGEFKWLTLVSPEAPGAAQLLLEPNDNAVAQAYQRAIYEQGIPHAAFGAKGVRRQLSFAFMANPVADHQKRWVKYRNAMGSEITAPRAFADSDDPRLRKMVAPLLELGLEPS
jgi:catechol 2,3-dioxygenase-like lactoylglutathione lyase family enzyme